MLKIWKKFLDDETYATRMLKAIVLAGVGGYLMYSGGMEFNIQSVTALLGGSGLVATLGKGS